MTDVPDKAIYKCPTHGLFMVETEGIVWRNRSCTKLVSGITGRTVPCGILSPLASVDDPDLTDKKTHVGGLTPDVMDGLRQSIEAVRAERQKESDRPNFLFGGSENRRNGRRVEINQTPPKDVEQELFEAAERERMRAAMNEDWDTL
jgi:hypothetical protein